jgi:hypothetical protein
VHCSSLTGGLCGLLLKRKIIAEDPKEITGSSGMGLLLASKIESGTGGNGVTRVKANCVQLHRHPISALSTW